MTEIERREELTELSVADLIEIIRDRYRTETGCDADDQAYIRQALISMIIDTEVIA
jgi:hypothetical protein